MPLELRDETYMHNDYFRTDLPSHWKEKRLGLLAKEVRTAFVDGPFGSDLKTSDYIDDGVPLIQLNNIRDSKHLMQNMKFVTEEKKLQLIRHIAIPGDVVIAKMAEPVARSAVVSDSYAEYVIVADCVKMSPDLNLVDLSFLVWAINSDCVRINAELVSTGTTRIRVNLGELKKLKVPYPPLGEQKPIANFLDHETAKIDTLIEKQQQLIKLLKEKRQAVISHAVTKGLDSEAPMRDSGIEWLGEVPEHWEVVSIKYLALFVGTGGTPKEESSFTEKDDINWFTPGDFNGEGVLSKSAKHITKLSTQKGDAKIYQGGSVLVIGIGATLGKVGYCLANFSSNQQINIITPNKKMLGMFMMHSLTVQAEQMKQLSNASTIGIMNQEKTKLIKTAVAPLSEQKEIIDHLTRESEKFNYLLEKAGRQVELLKERRTALISAAVTGKIDVRSFSKVGLVS